MEARVKYRVIERFFSVTIGAQDTALFPLAVANVHADVTISTEQIGPIKTVPLSQAVAELTPLVGTVIELYNGNFIKIDPSMYPASLQSRAKALAILEHPQLRENQALDVLLTRIRRQSLQEARPFAQKHGLLKLLNHPRTKFHPTDPWMLQVGIPQHD